MISISFFNNKGGVGKTTLLCNVAAYLSQEMGYRVCIVDCDPQCNASQYIFHDEKLEQIINDEARNIDFIFKGIIEGTGYAHRTPIERSASFNVDVICGSPRLSMAEDFLAEEWAQIHKVRGLSSTLIYKDLLSKLTDYDFVLFDVSPSLGAINRSILLSTDFFVSPLSVDIFSLKAFENISEWMNKWRAQWKYSINSPSLDQRDPVIQVAKATNGAKFLGYVSQQYIAKRDSNGEHRPVKSYEEIIKQIDSQIANHFDGDLQPTPPFEIGKIPNLYSLAPMSQSRRKPVFALMSRDGIVGAHFAKVKESKEIFGQVAKAIAERAGARR
ncbi:hypothetical protein HLBENOHH_01425 [Aeromonas dhakensis]|uniref:ParA family protein n=1 Tax=Aeromonas dhakensis TaxID=196024 RepID=UPI00366EE6B3